MFWGITTACVVVSCCIFAGYNNAILFCCCYVWFSRFLSFRGIATVSVFCLLFISNHLLFSGYNTVRSLVVAFVSFLHFVCSYLFRGITTAYVVPLLLFLLVSFLGITAASGFSFVFPGYNNVCVV